MTDTLKRLSGCSLLEESPLERSLRVQEDFERALSSHRALWLAEAQAEKAAFDSAFTARKEELTRELEVKLDERRAAKNMFVALFFILRLLG